MPGTFFCAGEYRANLGEGVPSAHANIPITREAAEKLHHRGVWIIPDIIANSGGVICAATEYQGLTADDAFAAIRKTIGRNTKEVLRRVREEKIIPHKAALDMAREPIDAFLLASTLVS